jgi:hypothetical protein
MGKSKAGLLHGYRSGLEETVAAQIKASGLKVEYESEKIVYVVPETSHTYTPDFVLPNGIIIETKGRFVQADRKKHVLIQKQRPDLDIRFVFTNSRNKLYKGSKTTYGQWCERNRFLYSDKEIPREWLTKKGNSKPKGGT